MKRVFLDYNATAPVLNDVKKCLINLYDGALNASSVHESGRKARVLVEDARKIIKKTLNADDDYRLVFTSSGTESNNMVLKCNKLGGVLVSCVEHVSVLNVIENAKKIKVDANGVVDLNDLQEKIKAGNLLVSVMLANNETGVLQPIKEIAKIVHENNSFLHVDAVQGFGKIEVDIKDLGADAVTISAHKIGGVQGAAALVFKKSLKIESLVNGGGQEMGYRGGTENVVAISAFGKAAQIANDNLKNMQKVANLRDFLESEIKKIDNNVIMAGQKVARLPNTSYISMPNVGNETQLMHFDMSGFEISAGSACSSGKIGLSHVLKEMGLDASNFVRVSIGIETKKEEIEAFVSEWQKLYKKVNKTKE